MTVKNIFVFYNFHNLSFEFFNNTRPVLLETPTFKQPLLKPSRPVLLPTPAEPPIPDSDSTTSNTHSYKKGRPSSTGRRDSQQDYDDYSYQSEDYSKKKRGKSSIYKKYKRGTKYSDFR